MPTWFHFVRNETLEYVVVQTRDGTLTVSPSHNVGFSSPSDITMFSHAVDLSVDDNLIGFTYSSSTLETTDVEEHPIVDIIKTTKMGLYAPYTRLHNYFVSDDGVHFYLAHAYAVVENPVAYEYVVGRTFDMLSSFVQVDETQNMFLNPIAKALHSVLQLYEDPFSVVRYLRRLTSKTDDDEFARTSTGANTLEMTDFLTLLAHTHATSVNVTAVLARNNNTSA
jgi:hypothetical protein